MSSPREQFIAGIKAISPILLGVAPFATISGVAAVEVGLNEALALNMGWIIFAGASQLATLQLIGVGAAALVILLTALIINLRFVMYSASLAPHFKHLPLRWRLPLAYVLTDQAYLVSITHYNQNPQAGYKHWFYLGASAVMWATWMVGTAVGVFLGAQVPPEWSLDFAIPLTFLALLVPNITDRPSAIAGLVAGGLSVLAINLPYNLSLIVAALVGISVGLLVETYAVKPK